MKTTYTMKVPGQLSQARRNALFGYGAAIVGLLSMGCSASAVQAMQRAIPDLLLAAFRYATQTFGVFLILLLKREFTPIFELRHLPHLMILTVLSSVYNVGLFAGASLLPLVDALGIVNTATMVCIASVHYAAKQSIGFIKLFSILLAISGMIMMMQPGWLFGMGDIGATLEENRSSLSNNITTNISLGMNVNSENCFSKTEIGALQYAIGTLCTVIAGITIGLYYILLKDILADFDFLHIAFGTGLFGTIICLVTSLYIEDTPLAITEGTWGLLMVHAVFASVDSVLVVLIVSLIGPLESSILFSLAILIMVCLQYTIMSSYIPGHRNWLEVVGAIVNFIGVLLSPTIDLTVLYKYSNPSFNDF